MNARHQGAARWLAEPAARSVFEAFPLPLVMAEGRGAPILTNGRFRALFSDANLEFGPLPRLIADPAPGWQTLRLEGHHGTVLEARAQAVALGDGVLIVLNDAPAATDAAAFEALHARVTELEHLCATDALTGAWNRAHLERTIEHEIARSLRLRQPLSLVLVDLDHFKRVNDTSGHAAGDAVLRALADTLRAQVRTSDLLFRWGGEEFAVLAPATPHPAAARMAEKLRAAVAQRDFAHAGRLTLSAGVAEHIATESASAWFDRVDARLYEAKRAGRDRVCVDPRGSSDAWSPGSQRAFLRLEWHASYACGEPTIDAQHRALFEQANVLLGASMGPVADRTGMQQAFRALLGEVQAHFRDEEALLAARGYTGLKAHARAHEHLLARALQLQSAAEAGGASLGEVVEFLANEVVARHLFVADRDYFKLFAS
jgi:hemerythrin